MSLTHYAVTGDRNSSSAAPRCSPRAGAPEPGRSRSCRSAPSGRNESPVSAESIFIRRKERSRTRVNNIFGTVIDRSRATEAT